MINLMNIFHVFLSIQKQYYYNVLCATSKSEKGPSSLGTQSIYGRHSKGIKGTYSGRTKGRDRTGIKETYSSGTKVHIVHRKETKERYIKGQAERHSKGRKATKSIWKKHRKNRGKDCELIVI